jgi:hypothetical protein
LVFELAKVLEKAKEDGKIGLGDLGLFIGLLDDLGPALENTGLIPSELKSLDKAKADELLAFVKQEFDIKDDKAEAFVEKALSVLKDVAELVGLIK